MKKTTAVAVIAISAALGLGAPLLATMDIQKEYRAKDAAADCNTCHVSKLPKKGESKLNDFGEKVQAAKAKNGTIDWAKVKR